MAKSATKTQPRIVPNPLEAVRAVNNEFKKAVRQEGSESAKAFISQLLGMELRGKAGESHAAPSGEKESDPTKGPVEIFSAANHKGEGAPKRKSPEKKAAKAESRQEAAMSHSSEVKNSGEKAVKQQNQENKRTYQDVQAELRQIVKHAKTDAQIKAFQAINYAPKTVKVYDNEFIRKLVKNAMISKEQAADSGSWLKVGKGKAGKKGYDPSNGMQHSTGEKTTIQNAAG